MQAKQIVHILLYNNDIIIVTACMRFSGVLCGTGVPAAGGDDQGTRENYQATAGGDGPPRPDRSYDPQPQ